MHATTINAVESLKRQPKINRQRVQSNQTHIDDLKTHQIGAEKVAAATIVTESLLLRQ